MQLCWKYEGEERPTFAEIVSLLVPGSTHCCGQKQASEDSAYEDDYIDMSSIKEEIRSQANRDTSSFNSNSIETCTSSLQQTGSLHEKISIQCSLVEEKLQEQEASSLQSDLNSDEQEEGGLLSSIIQHFEEKPPSQTDDALLTLTMEKLSTTIKRRSPTVSACHSPNHQSSTNSLTSTAREEDPYSTVDHTYDECPTTPIVTIAFKTGEKVTPSRNFFALTKSRARSQGNLTESATAVGAAGRSNGGKSISIVSMPLEWRERLRLRERSYTLAGDYVQMNPASTTSIPDIEEMLAD